MTDHITKRFLVEHYPDRKEIHFDLTAGDGTLTNGLFQMFLNGKSHFQATTRSTDANDTWELKFTVVAKENYTLEVSPHGNTDPHYLFHMDESDKDYNWSFPLEELEPLNVGGAFYVDIAYSC